VTCALDTQGDVYCWGGTYKDFATGTTILPFVNRPTKVDLPARISFIAMSGERVCAMAGPSRVWCWGKNFGSSPQEIKFQKPRVY